MSKQLTSCLTLLLAISLTSCSPDKGDTVPQTTNTNTGNNTITQGKGIITLVCDGKTFITAGNCNYSSGADCIVVADSNNNQNVFTLNLDGGLPTATKTYTITDHVSGADKAGMSFARFPASGKMIDWEATTTSGTVILTVEGNKITCAFNNVALAPSAMYNPDSLNHTGLCTGSFTLYK